jgi:hypothetical protein
MNNTLLLHILIAVHTLIAAVSTASLFYLPYAAIKGHSPRHDGLLVVALVWPLANLILMTVNGWVCPMQDWAKDLTGGEAGWVRDIFWVPESWLRIVPWTFPIGSFVGVVLVFGRLWLKRRV